jgi:hypothetical protein
VIPADSSTPCGGVVLDDVGSQQREPVAVGVSQPVGQGHRRARTASDAARNSSTGSQQLMGVAVE